MRAADLDLHELLQIAPEGGRITFAGERALLLDAVPAVLAVFNWPKNTDRYRRVQKFTEALFTNWDKFQHPPRHPKWRDVNLAATVPGISHSQRA